MTNLKPAISVIIPTFNNLEVLRNCLESWQRHATGQPVEILVIEDGCNDETASYLQDLAQSEWGEAHLRWFHEDDVHELRCNNRGFAESNSPLMLVWQDDMYLQSRWLVPEILSTANSYPEIGLMSLSRGLNCYPLDEPITTWEELLDWRRLESTIGPRPLNWFCLQEVDIVVRPWVVRRACLDRVGLLDEEFCPHEWDEADLCFRIREAGWKIATCGYERTGGYYHLGSSTLSKKAPEHQQRIALKNGLLFHSRWSDLIKQQHPRERRRWMRRSPFFGWASTVKEMLALVSTLHANEQNT